MVKKLNAAQKIAYPAVRPGAESQINLPGCIGRGTIKFMCLRSGVHVKVSDFTLNAPTHFDYTDFPPAFGFAFFLHGTADLFINGKKKLIWLAQT